MNFRYAARVVTGVFMAVVWLSFLFTLDAYTKGRVALCWFFILPFVAYFSGYYAVKWAQMIDDGRD